MKRYVIFGRGRVGSNMAAYIESLGHQVTPISRGEAENEQALCAERVKEADIVAAAIPDDKLPSWRDAWLGVIGEGKVAIHFSGAARIDGVYGFHPLYSFPRSVLSSKQMSEIAFAREPSAPPFKEVFPGASNACFEIGDEDRARYHALAVLAGNLPAFVWNEMAKEFAALTGMPAEKVLGAYLNSVVDRFIESPEDSMTGPVARRDKTTVLKNLSALEDTPKLKALYDAFVRLAWPGFTDRK